MSISAKDVWLIADHTLATIKFSSFTGQGGLFLIIDSILGL
jgi:hypothetical protein